jgi:hypothetical protein
MKNLNFKLILVVAGLAWLAAAPAWSDGTTATVRLKVATFDQVLFDNNFTVQPCPDSATGTTSTLNAWCAVTQLAAAQNWTATSSWSQYGVFLSGINNYNGADGKYWLWFSNGEPGATSLDQHLLTDNEQLLLTYGTAPLKVTTASTTPPVDSTSTLSALYFDTNAWQWQPAASSTLVINGEEFSSADGTWPLTIATTTPYVIVGRKTGFIDSPTLTITGVLPEVAPAVPDNSSAGGSGPSGGGFSHQTPDVGRAVNFLIANQNSDGSIGASLIYSDWAALALSAYGDNAAKDKLKNYLIGAGYDTAFGSPATNAARRAMALMALGINPYQGTSTDYISVITSAFDGQKFGAGDLFNSNIFALFPLLKAGYTVADPVVKATCSYIMAQQGADGSWGSVDLTAAAVQALSLVQKIGQPDAVLTGSINQSLTSAKQWLHNSQDSSGGFSDNTISTAWAVQAIAAFGEPMLSWENQGRNPLDFLASSQASDGGFEAATTDVGTRLWTTAYVIPAALNKTWGDIMTNFSKPTPVSSGSQPSASASTSATSTPDLPVATSTPQIVSATSTVMIAIPESVATSTAATSSVVANSDIIKPVLLTSGQPINKIKKLDQAAKPKAKPKTAASQNAPQVLGAKISDTGKPPTANNQTAKTIFYVSAGATVLAGLYLGLKFIGRLFK